MNRLLEVIAFWISIVGIGAAIFLLQGSPTVWDRLHTVALSAGRTECYKP